jgi:hypothetical protein
MIGMNGIAEAKAALHKLVRFIGWSQLEALRTALQGEERQFFIDKICELRDLVIKMPATYEQEGKGDSAVVYLHYFIGNCNWYITEKDSGKAQQQAFGLADLGNGPEYGYISIEELLANDVELDFYYRPRTIAEQMKGGKPRI